MKGNTLNLKILKKIQFSLLANALYAIIFITQVLYA